MKKFYISTIIAFLFSQFLLAQENINTTWEISPDNFDIQAPAYDTDAEAVVMYDNGETRFVEKNNGFYIRYTRKRRIKILKESGLKWADVSIPLYYEDPDNRESLKEFTAVTYNLNQDKKIEVTNLDKESVDKEIEGKNLRAKRFILPAVRVNSIIEYSYEIVSPFLSKLPDWEFQDRIPTIYSKYKVGIIPFYQYTYVLHGAKKVDFFKTTEEYNYGRSFFGVNYFDNVYEFVMKNVPAFKDEEYITSIKDYIIKLVFQLTETNHPKGGVIEKTNTWSLLNKEFVKDENFGEFVQKSEKSAVKILKEELSIENLSEFEIFKTIVSYVKSHFSWDGYYSKFGDKKIEIFLYDTTGSTAEINLFLTGMLNAAGIKARPVLISTRDHGRINLQYPYAHLFNNVIVLASIDGKNVLTDGTEPLLGCDRIPMKCINYYGLIIDKEGETWLDLNTSYNFPSTISNALVLKIDPEKGFIEAKIREKNTEYAALKSKKIFKGDPENYITHLEDKGLENVEIIDVKNENDPELPFIVDYEAKYPLEYIEDKILISPFLSLPISENTLKQKERKYPVDMIYRQNITFFSSIEIPEGYRVLKLPAPFNENNNVVTINLTTDQKENSIIITGTFQYKKAVFPAKEYNILKWSINEIVNRFNEKVVLKKI